MTSLLLRQAHPHFMDGDRITSQVFLPFPKDEGRLSVYDGDQISAEESHRHYTHILGHSSHSVWGVSGKEVDETGLSSVADPLPDFPAHALIDFRATASLLRLTEKDFRKFAKRLKALADSRGCLYQPGSSHQKTGGM